MSSNLNKRSIGASSAKKHDPNRKRKHKGSSKADKGPPRKGIYEFHISRRHAYEFPTKKKLINSCFFLVGRPRLNRTNEIPSGELKPEKPKPSQALLKQSNESMKTAVQNNVPVNEIPTLANEVMTVTTSEIENVPLPSTVPSVAENGVNLNVSNTQEVTTTEPEKSPETPVTQPIIVVPPSVTTTPPKIVQPTSPFVQVKAPTTTAGRVQSPNVKNFFIRKGIEKQPPNQQQIVSTPTGTFIATTQGTSSPQITMTQLPANKKIIIKSQQILVPANSMKQGTGTIMHVSGQQNISGTSTPISINANVIESSTSDLSGILDLPILFADNSEGTVQIGQSGQILNTSGSSSILLNTSGDRSTPIGSPTNLSNIFISSPDGKLPNRGVVISAAKVTKSIQSTVTSTAPTTNKVIFINRNQIKQQIVGTQTVTGTPIVKGLPTLKLMPTSMASSSTSTPITLQANQLTKLSPGTKFDLSTLKLVKNASPSIQGGIMKPLIINKGMPTKNAFVIKSHVGTNMVQAHPVIKGNVLNKNITVRKVMNVMSGVKQITTTPIAISSVNTSSIQSNAQTNTQTTTVAVSNTTSPLAPSTPPKTTRKTRNSN